MAHALVTTNTAPNPSATLLGQGPAAFPIAGKIRAGIKVLTRRAAEHPIAQQIYSQGVAAQQSFDDIERAIVAALPELVTPLVPKNVAWFTLRPADFADPAIVEEILARYGEDRGDGGRRLYRFPVVFPADRWQAVMPHELVAWGASERKYWSEYSADGRVRHCMTYAEVLMQAGGRRAIRIFGGRKSVARADNNGLCDPEGCPEYQRRECNLSGRFLFFMPGIKSVGAFELPTGSFYAMNAAIRTFETIAFMRGGRISGFLDGQRTPFSISKRLQDVARIDESGRAMRVAQWIIALEAPIDVSALLYPEDDDVVLAAAERAVGVLQGRPLEVEARVEAVGGEAAPLAPGGEGGADPRLPPEATPGDEHAFSAGEGGAAAAPVALAPDDPATSLHQVYNAAAACGVISERFDAYAQRRWGPGWKLNAGGRRRALAEIRAFGERPQGLAERIDAALNAASPKHDDAQRASGARR